MAHDILLKYSGLPHPNNHPQLVIVRILCKHMINPVLLNDDKPMTFYITTDFYSPALKYRHAVPREMNPLLRVLPLPIFWILTSNILNHLHAFSRIRLLMTVTSYHI
jgi:hypothetical protein